MTPNGKLEAYKAGELIKKLNIEIEYFYTSYQKRAIETLNLILNTIRIKNDKVIKAWQLNERHYGALTGLNKDEMKKKYGEDKIHEIRRSWDIKPKPLNKDSPYHPLNIETYNDIPRDNIPNTESLQDTYNRVVPYFEQNIFKNLEKNISIVAHGNSLRSICKFLFKLDNKKISKLEIPTGNPLLIKFKNSVVESANYLDKERTKDLLVF